MSSTTKIPNRLGLCLGHLTGMFDSSLYRDRNSPTIGACWNLRVLGGLGHDGNEHRALGERLSQRLSAAKERQDQFERICVIGCETDYSLQIRSLGGSLVSQLIGVVLSVASLYQVQVQLLELSEVRSLAYGERGPKEDMFDRLLDAARLNGRSKRAELFVDGRVAAAFWAVALSVKTDKKSRENA